MGLMGKKRHMELWEMQGELAKDARCMGEMVKDRGANIMETCTHMVLFSMVAHDARADLELALECAIAHACKDDVPAIIDACAMINGLRDLHRR
jgi:hypothetical protein